MKKAETNLVVVGVAKLDGFLNQIPDDFSLPEGFNPDNFSGYKGHEASVDLSNMYNGCEEKFPPKPRRTLKQLRDSCEDFCAVQYAIDSFFYLKLAGDEKFLQVAIEKGIEHAKELFEKMFDLGVYSIGFVDTDYVDEPYTVWLWWIGSIYSEVSRFIK